MIYSIGLFGSPLRLCFRFGALRAYGLRVLQLSFPSQVSLHGLHIMVRWIFGKLFALTHWITVARQSKRKPLSYGRAVMRTFVYGWRWPRFTKWRLFWR